MDDGGKETARIKIPTPGRVVHGAIVQNPFCRGDS
jgi:hypothetical protein